VSEVISGNPFLRGRCDTGEPAGDRPQDHRPWCSLVSAFGMNPAVLITQGDAARAGGG
jgi:hypothetical protein